MTSPTARDLLDAYRTFTTNSAISDSQLGEQARRVEMCAERLRERRVAILGDPVGTGKTAVALAAAALLQRAGTVDHVLISAPNSNVREQWRSRSEGFPLEFRSIVPPQRASLHKVPFQVRSRGGGAEMPKPACPERTLIVIDEAHRGLQSESNASYQRLRSLANGCLVLFVTATPMQLAVSGLETMLRAADPAVDLSAVKSFHTALHGFVTRSLDELENAPDPRMEKLASRARKSLGLYLLPPFDRHAAGLGTPPPLAATQVVAPSSWLLAYHVARVIPELVDGGKGDMFQRRLVSSSEAFWGGAAGRILTGLTTPAVKKLVDRLRIDLGEGSTHPKIRETTDWVAHRASGRNSRKVLVFCVFKETQAALLSAIAERLPDCQIDAPMSASEFERSAETFRRPDSKPMVLILTDKFSESVDLDRGRPCLVHHDLSWSPVRLEQRLGRVVRISSGFTLPDPDDIFVPVLPVETDTRLFKTANARSDLTRRLLAGEATSEIINLSDEDGTPSIDEASLELLGDESSGPLAPSSSRPTP